VRGSARSVERIYVHRDLAGPFVDALVRRAQALRVAEPRRCSGLGFGYGPERSTR
jgi:hypothetical protein